MQISNLSVSKDRNQIKISADVLFHKGKRQKMYFSTHLKNEKFVSSDYSPFLAAVLLPCMKTGEDIQIDGGVSKKLLGNTKKIMALVESWNIGLKKVNIIASKAKQSLSTKIVTLPTAPRNDKKLRTGVFFSAGVDSFYTYLKNKKEITDLILVHGFDVPIDNTLLFEKLKKACQKVASDEKKNLTVVRTNVAEVVEPKLVWDFTHGGALAAVGLFLQQSLSKVFISSAVRKDLQFPYGTHPQLDKLWSTEALKFVHEGVEYNRLQKIMNVVGKSNLALKYLHVCAQNIKGKYNCSKCYKCLITMIGLVCTNTLQKAKSFDHTLDLTAVKNMYYDYSLLYNVQGEANLEELKRQNREVVLQAAIAESLSKSKNPRNVKRIMRFLATVDQKYNKRRFYRLVFKTNKDQDRNLLFKFLLQRGAFK